jgi:hypothetical protein
MNARTHCGRHAVDPHRALSDVLVRLAPRAEVQLSHQLVQPHGRHGVVDLLLVNCLLLSGGGYSLVPVDGNSSSRNSDDDGGGGGGGSGGAESSSATDECGTQRPWGDDGHDATGCARCTARGSDGHGGVPGPSGMLEGNSPQTDDWEKTDVTASRLLMRALVMMMTMMMIDDE